jgi:dATP/dGTP diphosphohydrolase, N-terminal
VARTSDDLKHDGDKVRFELIDVDAETALAMVLTAGASEYRDHGWKGLDTVDGRERIIGSLIRHLNAYRQMHADDVACDDQFGLPHSAHLFACAMFLCAFDVKYLDINEVWPVVVWTWREALRALKEAKSEALV